MIETPPTGEARALLMEQWAARFDMGLSSTIAYADSTSDLPMLEAAGHPVVVNPEPKLAAIARKRGWTIENWQRAKGGPRNLLAVSTRATGTRTAPPATTAAWVDR
jgi:phosphoserine phosphatase